MRIALAIAAAALLVGPSAGAVKSAPAAHRAASAPAARDWTTVVSMTPAGGILMGSPAAKVKLLEYASFTCPHCAHFWADAIVPLRVRYIRTGAVSFEVRNFMRDRVDLAVTLLARCGGPAHFFARSDVLFSHQQEWLPAALSTDSMQGEQLTATPPADVLAAIATGSGLGELLRPQGLAAGRINACVADPVGQDKVVAMLIEAQRQGVNATPGFFINGTAAPVYTWATLEPRLRAALGS